MAEANLTAAPQGRGLWWRRGFMAVSLALLISLGAVLCFAPKVQRQAAGAFGGFAEKVKNRPAQTAVICLGGLVLLWGSVGLLAAGQEVHARLTRRRRDPS